MDLLKLIAESHRFAGLGFVVLVVLLVYNLLRLIIAKTSRFKLTVKFFNTEISASADNEGKTK